MYYIMRKSDYVMHTLLRYAKNVLRYAVIITLCGNYYVMRRHTRRQRALVAGRGWKGTGGICAIGLSHDHHR